MTIELTIETLTVGGRGLGRHQGKAVFVPLTAPGDRVRCRLTRDKAKYAAADLVELLEPSALRREPPCPYFGTCGGCQWQHLPYGEQAAWKDRLFRDTLVRQGLLPDGAVRQLVGAEQEFGYRNRVQFKCHQTPAGFVIGFYRSGSHYVIDVDRCLLLAAPLQRTLDWLRRVLPQSPCPAAIPQVDAACDDEGRVRIVLHVLPEGQQRLRDWLIELDADASISLCLQAGRKTSLETLRGDDGLRYRVDRPESVLQVSAGGFAQVNSEQNRRMVDGLIAAAGLQGHERVLDLFCGMGNFSLPLARRAAEVVGVEDYAPAIADARNNARRNRIVNARFHAEDAAGAYARHADGRPFDLVVLDPPRTGCYPVARDLVAARPPRILYVSCDPASLARDLKALVQGGYEIVFSQPYDLFPQTWHTESLTLLEWVAG